jgi:hypothetical protein
LETLPPGIAFPEDFPEPIAYDASRQLLLYRGIMSHTSYSYLRQLSGDAAYLTAVDQIRKTSCQLYAQRARPHFSRYGWLWLLGAVLLLASLIVGWRLR